MRSVRRRLAAGALVLLAAASLVYVVGAQNAGRICTEQGVDRLVPRHLRTAEPEGYGAEIAREGTCRITHDDEVYTEVPLARWDLTEAAVVLGILAGLCGAGLLFGWVRDRY